jgi:SAM-dependent methyltransferase
MPGRSGRIAKLRGAVARRGWRGLAALAATKVTDYLFDVRYGIETRSLEKLTSLSGTVGDLAHALPYQPTSVMALRRLLRTLDVGPGRVLVDFGCGKGRVLMVAAPFGFRALRGVEFSSSLCAVARANIDRFRRRSGVAAEFEIIHGDAGEYVVRDDEDVFFLFNPFDDHVLERVIANISRSFAARPRPLLLIYRRPVHEDIITNASPFRKVAAPVVWASDFSIFEAAPAGAGSPG